MQTINSILALFYKEYKMLFSNLYDLTSVLLFFLLGVLIFVFSIGTSKEIFDQINIGIIWTLLLFSANLTLKKIYQDDFNDGNIFLLIISGLSLELIVLIKLIVYWSFFQLPFLIVIPLAAIILNIEIANLQLIIYTFLISSPVLTSITSISGSMNLLNNKNFAIASLIVMILTIPLIIFSVGVINAPSEFIRPQLSILFGIFLFFLALTPWISATCIRIALRNS